MENMMKMETFRNQEFGSVRIIRDDGRLLFCGIRFRGPFGKKERTPLLYAYFLKTNIWHQLD